LKDIIDVEHLPHAKEQLDQVEIAADDAGHCVGDVVSGSLFLYWWICLCCTSEAHSC
jgi:hypothetical protein